MAHSDLRLIIVEEAILNRDKETVTSGNYQILNVPNSLTPDEIIQQELGLPLQTQERIPLRDWYGKETTDGRKYTLITRYSLKCPSMSWYSFESPSLEGQQLKNNVRLSEQGVIDDTVMVLVKRKHSEYDQPEDDPEYGVYYEMAPVSDVENFNEMVRTRTEELKFSYGWGELIGALLYTDEDAELAKYVRQNYNSLDRLSGEDTRIFVVERPHQISISETINYWKGLLAFEMYVFWGGNGWTRTKPYDKAAVYDIAKQLRIFPHQLPCIVFFEDISDEAKIIVPIEGDYSNFFRRLFGSIQESFSTFDQSDSYRRSYERRQRLIAIRNKVVSLGEKISSNEDTITYNFYGQTVFINQPRGPIQLSDFQNTLE